jgi:hypothetical protein
LSARAVGDTSILTLELQLTFGQAVAIRVWAKHPPEFLSRQNTRSKMRLASLHPLLGGAKADYRVLIPLQPLPSFQADRRSKECGKHPRFRAGEWHWWVDGFERRFSKVGADDV